MLSFKQRRKILVSWLSSDIQKATITIASSIGHNILSDAVKLGM